MSKKKNETRNISCLVSVEWLRRYHYHQQDETRKNY